jgi:hypothetical protein
MRRAWCWLLVIAASGFPEIYGASKARLLWELKFSAILAAAPGQSGDLQARDLAYSPDGNWIAAVVGLRRTRPESRDVLVLIPSAGGADQIRRVYLDHIAADTYYCKAVFWSPDSVHVAVRVSTSPSSSSFAIFRATDGKLIYRGGDIDEFLGFIDNHRFLVRLGSSADNGPVSRLRDQSIFVFDLEGAKPTEWPLLGTMRIAVRTTGDRRCRGPGGEKLGPCRSSDRENCAAGSCSAGLSPGSVWRWRQDILPRAMATTASLSTARALLRCAHWQGVSSRGADPKRRAV